MTAANYDATSLDKLRRYVLTHRQDDNAFHIYVERSKAAGRMIRINVNDTLWEENVTKRIQQMIRVDGESE